MRTFHDRRASIDFVIGEQEVKQFCCINFVFQRAQCVRDISSNSVSRSAVAVLINEIGSTGERGRIIKIARVLE